jgi:hypothetical protein
MQLTVDTSWYTRYRSGAAGPVRRQVCGIPTSNADFTPAGALST